MTIRFGAPGSVARHVQELLERNPHHFGMKRWLVYENVSGRAPILHTAQDSQELAKKHMKPGRVLIDAMSYLPQQKTA